VEEFVVGAMGWDGVALARSGKRERATARAAAVSAGEGRCGGGVGGISAWVCCGCDGGWVGVGWAEVADEAGRALRGSLRSSLRASG
jgi:hypothetical protein